MTWMASRNRREAPRAGRGARYGCRVAGGLSVAKQGLERPRDAAQGRRERLVGLPYTSRIASNPAFRARSVS